MGAEHDRLAMFVAALKLLWPHIASFTGAVITLAFVEKLNTRGKAFAVFFGFWVATLIGPIAHAVALHHAPFLTAEVVAPGINFLIALCAMAVIPPGLKAIGTVAGNPRWVEAMLKIDERRDDDGWGGNGHWGGGRRARGGDLAQDEEGRS